MKKPGWFGHTGDEIPVIWGLLHEPRHKDPVIKQPGFKCQVFFFRCSTVAIPGQVIMISLLSSTLSLGATDRYLQHPMLVLYHLDYIVPLELTTFIFGGYDSMSFFWGGNLKNLHFSCLFCVQRYFLVSSSWDMLVSQTLKVDDTVWSNYSDLTRPGPSKSSWGRGRPLEI